MAGPLDQDRLPSPAQPTPLERFCINCRYPLVGLTHRACPECGRAFDPMDPKTFAPTVRRAMWEQGVPYHAITAMVFALTVLLLFFDVWLSTGRRMWWRHGDDNAVLLPVFLLGVGVLIACNWWPDGKRSKGDLALGVLLVMGLLLTGFDRRGLVVYALSASVALAALGWMRALRSGRWWSRRLATSALLVSTCGTYLLISGLPLSLEQFVDYWTHWFWTAQRY